MGSWKQAMLEESDRRYNENRRKTVMRKLNDQIRVYGLNSYIGRRAVRELQELKDERKRQVDERRSKKP